MSASLIIFIIIHLFALMFFIEVLRRTSNRAKEYSLKESHMTLLFGVIRLSHMVLLYILTYFAWVILSVWLYFYFISPESSVATLENMNLNL